MVKFKLIMKNEWIYEIYDKIRNVINSRGELLNDESDIRPDYIIVIGGDGSILHAERTYPNIPKITFRKSDVGSKCLYSYDNFDEVIDKVFDNEFKIIREPKLILSDGISALNEVQLHNKHPTSAVRFSVYVNDKMIFENIIGDGVIIATPFGSTGYFSSAGGYKFENRIGIILNNPSNGTVDPELFSLDSKIKIIIHRGYGLIILDNNPDFIDAIEGNIFYIQKSNYSAKFVKVE